MRWNCADCIKYKKNERRNCGGKFPNSEIARKGYEVGPLKLFECPKTFIKRRSLEILKLLDSFELGKMAISQNPATVPNRTMEILRLVRIERNRVQEAIAQSQRNKQEGKWLDSMKK